MMLKPITVSLLVSILFACAPVASAQAPAEVKNYVNKQEGISMQFPAGWVEKKDDYSSVFTAKKGNFRFTADYEIIGADISLIDYVNASTNTMVRNSKDPKQLVQNCIVEKTSDFATIDGCRGKSIEVSFVIKDVGNVKSISYLIVRNGCGYTFSGFALKDDFYVASKDFFSIARSITLTDSDLSAPRYTNRKARYEITFPKGWVKSNRIPGISINAVSNVTDPLKMVIVQVQFSDVSGYKIIDDFYADVIAFNKESIPNYTVYGSSKYKINTYNGLLIKASREINNNAFVIFHFVVIKDNRGYVITSLISEKYYSDNVAQIQDIINSFTIL